MDDRGIPGWTATEGTEAFFSDVLKIEAWNLLRKFEQWACANDRREPISFVLFAMLTVESSWKERFMARPADAMWQLYSRWS